MAKVYIRHHKFAMPDATRVMQFAIHDTLWFLGSPLEDNEMTICIGIGIVKKIEKGEEFDLVGMDFGRGYIRDIFVKNNHARRQIYTLKKGQLAWFYGFMKCYKIDRKTKSSLYAKGFQGWYVPKNMDIMKVDPNDIEQLTQENESKINFIDELIKGEE